VRYRPAAERAHAKTRSREAAKKAGVTGSLFGEDLGGEMRTETGSRGDAEARRVDLWKAGGPVTVS
jgi:hypothetical protein